MTAFRNFQTSEQADVFGELTEEQSELIARIVICLKNIGTAFNRLFWLSLSDS
ncbi:MAG: hypothetical protein ACK5PB_02255 [Pirellula sp.]